MNYLPKNRSKDAYSKKILTSLVIFLLLAGLFYFFGGFIIRVASPVWKAENAVTRSFRNIGDFFSTRKTLLAENASLKTKIESLEIEIASLHLGEDRENVLLGLLERKPEGVSVTASVLTHPPQTPYDVLVLDAGSSDGVNIGDKVYLPEGPVLGLISDTFSKNSRLKLYSSSGESNPGILERGGVPIEILGQGGGNFKIILPRDTEVEIGDRILSAGIEADLLAVVEDIRLQPTDSFKEVLAKSPTNIFTLRFVFIRP